jgi:hypothetical protein
MARSHDARRSTTRHRRGRPRSRRPSLVTHPWRSRSIATDTSWRTPTRRRSRGSRHIRQGLLVKDPCGRVTKRCYPGAAHGAGRGHTEANREWRARKRASREGLHQPQTTRSYASPLRRRLSVISTRTSNSRSAVVSASLNDRIVRLGSEEGAGAGRRLRIPGAPVDATFVVVRSDDPSLAAGLPGRGRRCLGRAS